MTPAPGAGCGLLCTSRGTLGGTTDTVERTPPLIALAGGGGVTCATRGMVVLRDTHRVMPEDATTPDLVERVRRQFEAGNRRDIDAVMSSFAVDAVLEGRALSDIFEGQAAIRAFGEGWFGLYEELSSNSRRSTTSATELCLLWSSKRLGLLASPVTFGRERDGSTSRWEV